MPTNRTSSGNELFEPVENALAATLNFSASEEDGRNFELSFFCTVERLPKRGPVTLEIPSHTTVNPIAMNSGLRCGALLFVALDKLAPFGLRKYNFVND